MHTSAVVWHFPFCQTIPSSLQISPCFSYTNKSPLSIFSTILLFYRIIFTLNIHILNQMYNNYYLICFWSFFVCLGGWYFHNFKDLWNMILKIQSLTDFLIWYTAYFPKWATSAKGLCVASGGTFTQHLTSFQRWAILRFYVNFLSRLIF